MRKPYPCKWNVFATKEELPANTRWDVILDRRTRQWSARKVQLLPWGDTVLWVLPVNPEVGRACHALTVAPESVAGEYPTPFGGQLPHSPNSPDIAPTVDPAWCDGRVWEMPAVYGLRQAIMAYCREHHIRATFPSGGKAAGVSGFYFQAVRGE